jgi:hypothetical protein
MMTGRTFIYIATALFVALLFMPAGYASTVFTSAGSLTIRDAFDLQINPPATADPYPWNITVSGLTGVVSNVDAILHWYTHTWPEDVDMLLVGPTGASMILMSDAGGSGGASSADLTFSDSAADYLPQYTDPVTGTYKPTNYEGYDGDGFPASAPAGPYGSTLSVFNGTDPNGTWKLYVVDDSTGDRGSIYRWKLSIDTEEASAIPEPSTVALVLAGLAIAVLKRRRASA